MSVRTFKLQHNKIDQGIDMALYINECKGTLRELHLSHNAMDMTAAKDIFVAVALAKMPGTDEFAYPRSGRPLWLRMEWDTVELPGLFPIHLEESVSEWRSDPWLKTLGATGNAQVPLGCSSTHCSCPSTPAVHTPYLFRQQVFVKEEKRDVAEPPKKEGAYLLAQARYFCHWLAACGKFT